MNSTSTIISNEDNKNTAYNIEDMRRLLIGKNPVFIKGIEDIVFDSSNSLESTNRRTDSHRLIMRNVCDGGARLSMRNDVLLIEPTGDVNDKIIEIDDSWNEEEVTLSADTAEIYLQRDPGSLNALIEKPSLDSVFSIRFEKSAINGHGKGWTLFLSMKKSTIEDSDLLLDYSQFYIETD